ncbi:MAG: hypothetical protein ACPHVX_05500, partial [Flavobacteriaceae bacterium]
SPVAVITVSKTRALVCSSMDLLYQRGHPNGVNPKIVKISLLYFSIWPDNYKLLTTKVQSMKKWLVKKQGQLL